MTEPWKFTVALQVRARRQRHTQLRGDEAQEGKKQRREETGDHLMFLLKEIQSFLERT